MAVSDVASKHVAHTASVSYATPKQVDQSTNYQAKNVPSYAESTPRSTDTSDEASIDLFGDNEAVTDSCDDVELSCYYESEVAEEEAFESEEEQVEEENADEDPEVQNHTEGNPEAEGADASNAAPKADGSEGDKDIPATEGVESDENGISETKDAKDAKDTKDAKENKKTGETEEGDETSELTEEEEEKALKDEQETLQKEVDELQEDLEAKQKELEEKEKEQEEIKKEQERLLEEMEKAKAEGDEDKLAELQGRYDGLTDRLKTLDQEMEGLKGDIKNIQADLKDKQKALDGVNSKIADLEAAKEAKNAPEGEQPVQEAPQAAKKGGGNGGGGNGGGKVNGSSGGSGSPSVAGTATRYDFSKISDKDMAAYIDSYLKEKGSPAAGTGAGELMVKYGKEYDVDPLLLLAIAGHETRYGKVGVGVNGMLGVGAYDSNPNNAVENPTFSGVENQIRLGAKTFANLRQKGGASSKDDISVQTAAVNKAGWATDTNWHNGVDQIYNQISADAAAKLGAPALQSKGVSDMLFAMGKMVGLNEHNKSDAAKINAVTKKSGLDCTTTPWCAAFAMNMLKDYGVLDTSGCPSLNGCTTIMKWAKGKNIWRSKGSYTPQPGDAILFNWDGGKSVAQHIGVVEKVENGKVYTIEGNSKDSVRRKEYSLSSGNILGYIDCAASKR